MSKAVSPLRYPGGKMKIYDKIRRLFELNDDFHNRTYVEPFAGGFGIGIKLLRDGMVNAAILNDYDRHIFNFWFSVINDTESLIKLITDTKISIDERTRQKEIYKDNNSEPLLDGFATLFLNRVNYSGVLKGGPIGGLNQVGKYPLDCRFNKSDIIQKIRNVAEIGGRITLLNNDASDLIINLAQDNGLNLFFNIDPPYVVKGSQLYTSFYRDADHRILAALIAERLHDMPWIITYDNCALIKEIYADFHMQEYELMHNAGGSVMGKEIVITNLRNTIFEW